MHISLSYFRFLFFLFALVLFGCSSGNGGGSSTGVGAEVIVAPTYTSIISGDESIEINWTHSNETGGEQTDGAPVMRYNLYYANATLNNITIADLSGISTQVVDIVAADGSQVIEEINALSYTLTGLDNLALYYFILTAIEVVEECDEEDTDCVVGEVIEGFASSEGIAMPRASVVTDQVLNDTGVTLCGDYAFGVVDLQDMDGDGLVSADESDEDLDGIFLEHDNRIDCFAGDLDDDLDPIPALTQQDYAQGLDSTMNDDSDGLAGFSFTKLDENGVELVDQDADEWFCVQDNVTGLIWETKTDDEEDPHYSKDRFTWFSQDTTTNGEFAGYNNSVASCQGYTADEEATYCNTAAYIDRVNADLFCGSDQWRLPNLVELRSLVNYGAENEDPENILASIDLEYFPYTEIDGGIEGTTLDGGVRYWTSQTHASISSEAWSLYFGYGGAPRLSKLTPNAVRLVHDP